MSAPRPVTPPEDDLSALGLADPLAVTVYTCLVSQPGATATTVATRTGSGPAEVEQALAGLVDLGLVVPDGSGWDAVPPDSVLGARLAEHETALRSARRLVGVLEREHRAARRSAHPADVVEILSGAEAVGRRLFEIQGGARTSIRGLDKPPYVSVRPGANPGLRTRIEEGLDVRVVLDGEAAAWPDRLTAEVLPTRALGDHVRVAERLPVKVFLVDGEVALVPVTQTETSLQQAAYVVHRGALLDALVALFEHEWARAAPLPPDRPGAPDPATAALLTLLAAGQSDLAIARALGVSERTVQRRVQGLLVGFGVSTRFQAGVRARECGWV